MSDLARHYQPVVLVVDDDADVQEIMTHMLNVRGFRVLTAADPDTALEVCRSQGGLIDVLIADLSLPGDKDGRLARRVAAEFPDIKIVFATGIPRHIALSSGLVQPDAPYLEKPVSADVLTSLMRSMLPQYANRREDW